MPTEQPAESRLVSDANASHDHSASATISASQQLSLLRQLLCGDDYQRMVLLSQQLHDEQTRQEFFAAIIAEAIAIRNTQDDAIAKSLAPLISDSMHTSIRNDPESVSDALYPVMGPAIRKSITETIQALFDGFNKALEDSLSLRSLGWRVDAWRTGKSYSEVVFLKTLNYRVEEVFLIHKETGLLVHQVAQDLGVSKDADMMSAMLTAIQDFITDSFEVGDDERLASMKMGSLTILLEPGPNAVLAVAVRGNISSDYRSLLVTTQEQCHRRYARQLREFDGDTSSFRGIDEVLRMCLKEELQKPVEKKRKIPVYGILGLVAVLGGLGWLSYERYLADQAWHDFVARLDQTPGLLVRSTNNYERRMQALKDPVADSQTFIHEASQKGYHIDWQTYVAVDDDILKRRLTLLMPEATALDVNQGVVSASGTVTAQQLAHWQHVASLMPGVVRLDTDQVQVSDGGEQQQLLDQIQRFQVYYDVGQHQLSSEGEQAALQLFNNLIQLANTLDADTESLHVTISGFSDDRGSDRLRRTISQQRADTLRTFLLQQGVPARLISTEVGDERQMQDVPIEKRRVSIARIEIKPVNKLGALQ